MAEGQFPIGRRISLPGHFSEPVMLESVRPLGEGHECRVRLQDGSLEQVVLSCEESALIAPREDKLLTNWRSVIDGAVESSAERSDRKRGQQRLDLK
jgi:hypothetical protein